MEDNIGDMMDEIRKVVSNHLSDVKEEFQDTINVLNTLPLVIALRKQLRTLEDENKQLKMLIKGIGEEKNIELEIMEVPKVNSSLESAKHTPTFELSEDGANNSNDEDFYDTSSADGDAMLLGDGDEDEEDEEEDELQISPDHPLTEGKVISAESEKLTIIDTENSRDI